MPLGRQIATLLLIPLLGNIPVSAADVAPAPIRDRGWDGVRKLGIVVQMDGGAADLFAADAAQSQLCERLRLLAARAAPIPVACLSEADAATADAGVAILAVQAALERQADRPRLIYTIRRTMQAGTEPAPILFGTAPRSVPWGTAAADHAAIDAALSGTLARLLPWRAGDRG